MSVREFTTAPSRPAGPSQSADLSGRSSAPGELAEGVGHPGMPGEAGAAAVFDPLRYCIFTTLMLLAWLVGPVPMVAITSAVGLAAYWKARREGLTRSR